MKSWNRYGRKPGRLEAVVITGWSWTPRQPALTRMRPVPAAAVSVTASAAAVNRKRRWNTAMFERVDYRVERIDGDYAYLKRTDVLDDDEKCVARALLPGDINEGSRLAYEMLEYTLL